MGLSLKSFDPNRLLKKAEKTVRKGPARDLGKAYHALVTTPVKQFAKAHKRAAAPLFPLAHWPEQPQGPTADELAKALTPGAMPYPNSEAAAAARRRQLARQYSRRGRQSTILTNPGGGGRLGG